VVDPPYSPTGTAGLAIAGAAQLGHEAEAPARLKGGDPQPASQPVGLVRSRPDNPAGVVEGESKSQARASLQS